MMGNRLKNIMEREGVKAYHISRDLGIDRGMLSKFLSGKCNLSLPKLIQIADYLGYDVEFVKRKRSRKGE